VYVLRLTSGQSNLTQGCVTAAHGRFNRIRQIAQMRCDITGASFDPPESTAQTAPRSVQPFLPSSLKSVVRHAEACSFS